MPISPSLLIVGLDPALVSTSRSSAVAFPEMDAETIRAGMAASSAEIARLGVTTSVCLVDYGTTAESVYRDALRSATFDFVVIGAGVRMDSALTHLLEVLVSATRELAPQATLLFNTDPTTTAAALRRWFPEPTPLRDPTA